MEPISEILGGLIAAALVVGVIIIAVSVGGALFALFG